LLYWLGHATPDALYLDDEKISPDDLYDEVFSRVLGDGRTAGVVFLNACQTGEVGAHGSFLHQLQDLGITGVIATEQQTIDTFANEFGLAFLEGFLYQGKPLGELLHELRVQRAPLGLIYGAHCPPEIRVKVGAEPPASLLPAIGLVGPLGGVSLGTASAATPIERRIRKPLELPAEPYRSLAYFEEADRALFTGRDRDILRLALPAFQGVTSWNSPQLLSQQALIRGGGSGGNPATSVCHTRV